MQDIQEPQFELAFSVEPSVLCYSLAHALGHARLIVSLTNKTDQGLKDFTVTFTSSAPFLLDLEKAKLKGSVASADSARNSFSQSLSMNLQQSHFSKIAEQAEEQVIATVRDKNGNALSSQACSVTLMPMDFWNFDPRCLAVFVERNNPYIKQAPSHISSILQDITGDPSLKAYQGKKAQDVLDQCSAIYTFLQNQGLIYCEPIQGNEDGQRIRSFKEILANKAATCLDTTLIFCSIAECIGLHPLICLLKDHCFPGVWLNEDDSFDSIVHDDPTDITQYAAAASQRLLVFESTFITNKPKISFSEACRSALQRAGAVESLVILDVSLARKNRIYPMAYQTVDESGNAVYIQDNEFTSKDNRLQSSSLAEPEYMNVDNTPKTRLEAWQRKLLDSSTRNSLLSARNRASVMQLLCPDLDRLESELASFKEFTIIENPTDDEFETMSIDAISKSRDLLSVLIRKQKMPASQKGEELERRLSRIYRQAQKDLSETGANTLYLTMGHLQWTDRTGTLTQMHNAPILLLPISLVKRSRSEYAFRLRDDEEPVLNYSIFEKLRVEMGMNIPLSYDALPHDESGLDVQLILQTVRQAILREKRWAVVESCLLGLFSFDQLVMYNDLRCKSELLASSKVVKSLMNNRLAFRPKPLPTITDEDLLNFRIPVSCDQTQLRAIKAAMSGSSFILQGPPGTGKSQTITALIACAMSKGKKVLFVAEKMAALQVVYRNLSQIGLCDYLLELHSIKASKEHFIGQLSRALERPADDPAPPSGSEKMLKKLDDQLSQYVLALHSPTSCGLSLYELINGYEEVKDKPVIPLSYAQIKDVTRTSLDECRNQLFLLGQKQSPFGKMKDNPFRFIKKRHEIDVRIYPQIELKLRNLSSLLESLDACIKGFQKCLKETSPVAFSSIEGLGAFQPYKKALSDRQVSVEIIVSSYEEIKRSLASLIAYRQEQARLDEALEAQWNMDIESQDIPGLLQAWGHCKTGIFKGRRRKELINKVGSYALFEINESNIEEALRKLNALAPAKARIKALKEAVPASYLGLKDCESILIDTIKAFKAALSRLSGSREAELSIQERNSLAQSLFTSSASDKLIELCNSCKESFSSLATLLELDAAAIGKMSIAQVSALMLTWADQSQMMQNWIEYNGLLYAIESRMAFTKPFVRSIQQGQSIDDVYQSLLASFYKAQAQQAIQASSVLFSFTSRSFDATVSKLQEVEAAYRSEIKDNLSPSIGSLVRSRPLDQEALRQIKYFIGKHGRSSSIRKVFETCDTCLADLFPCFLMSPLSVSQYLEPGRQLFDLVIFDEASQIPTCKAIGAISRGKDLVIVGDSKQMPPTSFFQKSDTTGAIEPDEAPGPDLDSILDDCLSIGFPEARLEWHYRSTSESLIYFSNLKYYNGRLKTYPSVDCKTSKVVLRHVNGYYQNDSRIPNEAEADAIASEIKKRLSNPATRGQSIAVITFSEKQQNLIQNKLEDLFEREQKLALAAHWTESEIDNPNKLIVKNLENIQGDERDVVMLSVTFGKTASGRFAKNFGPINQIGGEKRLNVAFSRAKKLMLVFTIIDIAEFSNETLRSQGAIDLREFLRYAASPYYRKPRRQEALAIKKELADSLMNAGFKAEMDIGMSDYKVDIGIRKADDKPFCCAVLLDGQSMLCSDLTNDRFNLTRSVLAKRGWQIVTARTIDWWNDPESTKAGLIEEVRDALEKVDESQVFIIPDPEPSEEPAMQALPYQACRLDMDPISPSAFPSVDPLLLLSKLEQVIEQEGPIIEDLLQARVLRSFKIQKRSPAIQETLNRMLSNLSSPRTIETAIDQFPHKVFWPKAYNGKDPAQSYREYRTQGPEKRSIEEIPQIEIRNCMLSLISLHGELAENLKDQAMKKLGFSRKGSSIQAIMDLVYSNALEERSIIIDPESRRAVPNEAYFGKRKD